tara:strand:+ start:423 stop:776 length:354 start_codon:yes stop_codon:yes gene_type:complete
MKIDNKAANTGIVATAVKTIITEVSIMPSVKHIEFSAKAKIKIIPWKLNSEHNFFRGSDLNRKYQIKKRVIPISIPRQPIKGHLSSFENLITIVSGVRISTPKIAVKLPNPCGNFFA